jgi:hypothetical protein
MKLERTISLPQLWLLAATRGALGFGIGLLVSEKFSREQRQAIGKTLLLVGIATSIPLAIEIFKHD